MLRGHAGVPDHQVAHPLPAELTEERTREKQRAEKLLESAAIKLSSVVSDLHGVTGRDIMDHLIARERDPKALTQLARARARRKISQLEEALEGPEFFTAVDMTRFRTGGRLPSWAGKTPLDNQSGTRRKQPKSKKGHRYLAAITGETAAAVSKTQTREGALLSRPGTRYHDLGRTTTTARPPSTGH